MSPRLSHVALALLLVATSASATAVFLSPAQLRFMVRAQSYRGIAHVEVGAAQGLEMPTAPVEFEVGFHVPRLEPSFQPGGEVSLHLRFADGHFEKLILRLSRYALYRVHATAGSPILRNQGTHFQEVAFLRLLPHQQFVDWQRSGALRDDLTPHAVFRYEVLSPSGQLTALVVGIPYGNRDDAPPFAFLTQVRGQPAIPTPATQAELRQIHGVTPDWLVSNEALLHDSLAGNFTMRDVDTDVAADPRLATLQAPSLLWRVRAGEATLQGGGTPPPEDVTSAAQALAIHFNGPSPGDLLPNEESQLRAMTPQFLTAAGGSLAFLRRALATSEARELGENYTSLGITSAATQLLLLVGRLATEQPTPAAPRQLDFTGDTAVFDLPQHPRPHAQDPWENFALAFDNLLDPPAFGELDPEPLDFYPPPAPPVFAVSETLEENPPAPPPPPPPPPVTYTPAPRFISPPPPAVAPPPPPVPLLNGLQRADLRGAIVTAQATGNNYEAERCASMLARDEKRRDAALAAENAQKWKDHLAATRR